MAIKMDDLVALSRSLLSQGGDASNQFLNQIFGNDSNAGLFANQYNDLINRTANFGDVQQQINSATNPITSQSIQDALYNTGVADNIGQAAYDTGVGRIQGPGQFMLPENIDRLASSDTLKFLPHGQLAIPGEGFFSITDAMPGITNEGLTPDAMAALTGSNIDRQSQAFDEETRLLKTDLARRGIIGGAQPGSGIAVDPLIQLAAAKAAANAKAYRDAILANQEQLFKNRAQISLPQINNFLRQREQDINAVLQQRGQGINLTEAQGQLDQAQREANLRAILQGRGQDIDLGLGQRGQDITARGQTLESLLGQRGQDITGRGQTLNALAENNAQNINAQAEAGRQELERRNLLINALHAGNETAGTGNALLDLALRGYGVSTGQQQDVLGQLTNQKESALKNDRSGFLNSLAGGLGSGLGAGLTGGIGGLIGNIGNRFIPKPRIPLSRPNYIDTSYIPTVG